MTNNEQRKNIVLRVNPELHKKVKIQATLKDTTLQDYVVRLIEDDLQKNEKE